MSERHKIQADWDHDDNLHPEVRTAEILPGLQNRTLRQMAEATGLSKAWCSHIKRGLKVPHPRHWQPLLDLAKQDSLGGNS